MSRRVAQFLYSRSLVLLAALPILVALDLPAHADGLLKVEQTVFGMDCAPCAYGIQKGVMALPGVKQATVNLNTGVASIVLAPDSPTTLAQIRKVILEHGFSPKQARVMLSGELQQNTGRYWLIAGGTRYLLSATKPGILSTLKPGEHIVVEGQIAAGHEQDSAVTVTRAHQTPSAPASPRGA